ncbi:MAG: cysteine-rich CWC family protein [Piscinibacter sp.]
MAEPAPLESRCPRCGGEFHCGVMDSGPCACTTLTLSPALRAELGARFQGCLCLSCLRALAAGAPLDLPRSA